MIARFLVIPISTGLLLALTSIEPANGQPFAQQSTAQQAVTTPAPDSQKAEAQPAGNQSKKPAFSLTVTNDQIIGVSLRATEAKLTDVAAELSRKLKAPVQLSPLMSKQSVTVDFRDLTLEASMQLLAPEVYIDYELNSTPGISPRPLGIFLQAYNEPPPALNAVVKNRSQTIVITGNTEDDPSVTKEDEPLTVVYAAGNLTVKAKEQLLVEVLSRISTELGIPLEADDASNEMVTVDIVKTPAEAAILQLAPNIRLFVRAHLGRTYRTPLRISMGSPEKPT